MAFSSRDDERDRDREIELEHYFSNLINRVELLEKLEDYLDLDLFDEIRTMVFVEIEERDLAWLLRSFKNDYKKMAEFLNVHYYGATGQGGLAFMPRNYTREP